MVAVEGLPLPVQLEQWLLQALQKAFLPDIGAGIVDKHARLHIAGSVDMAINAASGHAAAGKLTVILEVNAVQLCDLFAAEKVAHSAVSISSVN